MWIKHFKYCLIVAFAIAAPFIVSNDYERELLVMTCIFALAALSLDLIMGHMGQFSFGHQAFFGLGAYTSALLTMRLGFPVWFGFIAAIAMSAFIGCILGYVALRATRGMALAMITLGFGMILWLVACHWYDLTKGMTGLHNVPSLVIPIPYVFEIEFRSELSYYYLVLAMLLLTMYFIRSLLNSRFGRALAGLRQHEDLTRSIGVFPFRYYLVTFMYSTAIAGLAGALYGHHYRFVNPMLLSLHYIIIMLIIVLVGGTRTLGGPVLGAVLFVFVPEHLPLPQEFRYLLFGGILLLSIIFMPKGIYPYLVGLWNRLFGRAGSGLTLTEAGKCDNDVT